MALIIGTTAAELLTGSSLNDSMEGGDGNDTLRGLPGNDMLLGQAGDDVLTGDEGNDTMTGGTGADTFDVSSFAGSADVITDFSVAAGDSLRIDGHVLADLDFDVDVTDADSDGDLDVVLSLEDNATFSLTLQNLADFDEDDDDDDLPPPPPPVNQTLTGTAANDTLTGGDGNDTILGNGGDDMLQGAGGADHIEGGDGNDNIAGGAGNDMLLGQGGDDIVNGGTGNDRIDGGAGDDTLTGGAGADDFVFTFGPRGVEGGTSSYSQWRADHGLPPLQDGVTTQGDFASSYTHWLESLVDEFALGSDTNLDGDIDISVDINQNDPDGTPMIEGMTLADLEAMFGDRQDLLVKTGNTTHTRFYSDTFEIGDRSIFSGVGQDVITDFNVAEGDQIHVSGIPLDMVQEFHQRIADLDGNGTLDTEFSLDTDSTWTVQLMGVAGINVDTSVVVEG